MGLLHPVTVFKANEKYELVAGQRRLLAVTKLGWQKIPAQVIEKPRDPVRAKAISFSESFMRKPLVNTDLIDCCVEFYHKYGSMKAVSEELGLPYHEVRNYVKYERLPDKVKDLVTKNKVKMGVALKAVDAATQPDNTVEEERAVALALEMAKMDGAARQKLVEEAEQNPTESVESLVEKVRKPPPRKELTIVLLLPKYESLKKFTSDGKYSSEEEAAADLVVEGLTTKGYVEAEAS